MALGEGALGGALGSLHSALCKAPQVGSSSSPGREGSDQKRCQAILP